MRHSRSGSTASSDFPTAYPSPYSIASNPISSRSSQGFYSPDSQFAQAAYDATLPPTSHWDVGAGGYVETVNPQYTSKKRGFDQVNNYFEDVKRHKLNPIYDDGVSLSRLDLIVAMMERLSAFSDLTDDFFKQPYNTYQTPSQNVHSQRYGVLPSLRTRQDCIDVNQFLLQLQSHVFDPQYSTNLIPPYPGSSKALYPTLDLDYNTQADVPPSTNVYPQLFDQTPTPPSTYVGMGTRMPYDQTKLVYAGTLQRAPPCRSGSEELVQDMENMDVDSEAKEQKSADGKVTSDNDVREKRLGHLELINKLQKMVEGMMLLHKNEEGIKEVKSESP